MIMNSVHQEVAVPGPSGSANVAGVAAGMAMRLACQPTSRRRNSQEPEPLPPIECFPTPPETRSVRFFFKERDILKMVFFCDQTMEFCTNGINLGTKCVPKIIHKAFEDHFPIALLGY